MDNTPETSSRCPRRLGQVLAGLVAALAVAVGGAGMIDDTSASAAGVDNHNYAVITQTVEVPTPPGRQDD